jgi:shikimate dehydrogenase
VEIGASARLLVILGDPVVQSLSPQMHNAAIQALGLDGVYVALHTPGARLAAVLDALAAVGAAGNVTVPHKEATERYVSRKTDTCVRAGACNTFWVENGALVGDNTDVAGILACARRLADGARRWLVLGTGGSARAVAVAAAHAGAELLVRSRAPERARAFADWAVTRGARARAAGGVERERAEVDLVINATPLGLKPQDPLPLEPAALRGAKAALDLVYAAGETRWVRALRAAGLTAQDGREMLVDQGAAAFARFFPGHHAPTEVMRAAVARALRE